REHRERSPRVEQLHELGRLLLRPRDDDRPSGEGRAHDADPVPASRARSRMSRAPDARSFSATALAASTGALSVVSAESSCDPSGLTTTERRYTRPSEASASAPSGSAHPPPSRAIN